MGQQIQTASFVEMIVVKPDQTSNSVFDIVIEGEVTLQKYCEAIIAKIFDLTRCQFADFIDYQTNISNDSAHWLCNFEKLIENNEIFFTSIKGSIRFNKICAIIDEKRIELRSKRVKVSKCKIPKSLINAESKFRDFSFSQISKELDLLVCDSEKIILLTKEKFEYQKANIKFINQKLPFYDEQCTKEIEQIYALQKLEATLVKTKTEDNNDQIPSKKLKFNGNVNQLVDVFYQLNRELFIDGKSYIDGTTNEIVALIVNSFLDKDGNEISPQTVETILKPSRSDKRPKPHKRLDIDKLL